jgi:hypothetical protein
MDLVGFTSSGLSHTNWVGFRENLPGRLDRLIGEQRLLPDRPRACHESGMERGRNGAYLQIARRRQMASVVVVLAHHQAFARIVGAGDLGHVAVVEQRGLQRPARGRQLLDRRSPQPVIQSRPAGRSVCSMRALVSTPRSPTITTRCR